VCAEAKGVHAQSRYQLQTRPRHLLVLSEARIYSTTAAATQRRKPQRALDAAVRGAAVRWLQRWLDARGFIERPGCCQRRGAANWQRDRQGIDGASCDWQ
jgi:hypothetical protein